VLRSAAQCGTSVQIVAGHADWKDNATKCGTHIASVQVLHCKRDVSIQRPPRVHPPAHCAYAHAHVSYVMIKSTCCSADSLLCLQLAKQLVGIRSESHHSTPYLQAVKACHICNAVVSASKAGHQQRLLLVQLFGSLQPASGSKVTS
jgi:hypothetical protein